MAGRGATSFQKRQKENARKEKQQEKLERKQQRKLEKSEGGPPIEAIDPRDLGLDPEEGWGTTSR